MLLSEKINSLTTHNLPIDMNILIDHSAVWISATCNRMLKVDGYEGEVNIDVLAMKFLREIRNVEDLNDRLKYYELWDRIYGLYEKSLASCFYPLLVHVKEFRPWCKGCAGDPMSILSNHAGHSKEEMFRFTPEKYKELWPDVEPSGKCWSFGNGESKEYWYADKEMVEEAADRV